MSANPESSAFGVLFFDQSALNKNSKKENSLNYLQNNRF
jgi:hypothetical protein